MVQSNQASRPCLKAIVYAAILIAWVDSLRGEDRTTLMMPLSKEVASGTVPEGLLADQAFGSEIPGWKAYVAVWKAHCADPSDDNIRRFLGLPLKGAYDIRAIRGRSAPRSLRWKSGTYAQVDTPHFVIYSRAPERPSKRLAADLERCYWAWTQMFFPLWESSLQVATALRDWSDQQPIADFLKAHPARITTRRKLRVVLFRDASEYQSALAKDNPGIERSTGFYDNGKQTIYLYAAETDDAATRRHELVHQLFREATRSGLGRSMPGEQSGFWLIEGIAGYFESLVFGQRVATVGGWDCPRLQYARYRVLVGGDVMPLNELRMDGRVAAQQRQDITRWYSHSIARTHQLLDGGDARSRRWIYTRLADLYRIKTTIPAVEEPSLSEADLGLRRFLAIDDQHIRSNPVRRSLKQLVLAGCQVTEQGLSSIPPSPGLEWLDCARLPLGNAAIQRLVPDPTVLQQLTLEVTKVDEGLLPWLKRSRSLSELDLSFTNVGDPMVLALSDAKNMSVLWLTGTKITDRAVDVLTGMSRLESLDVQRTQVTESGLSKLRSSLPNTEINPLQLR